MSIVSYVSPDYLRLAASSPVIQAIRRRAYQLMGLLPGWRVLDIGCGPGTATLDMARIVGPLGHVTGIDADADMVREADAAAQHHGVAGWTTHQVADATALPFATASLDACHCERVLQHLTPEQVDAALAEAMRVTRPGGAVVCVDSDWATFSVDTTEPELERRLHAVHLSRFRNPFSGRTLGRLLQRHGFGFIATEPVAVPLLAASAENLLGPTEREAAERGILTDAEWQRWRRAVAERRLGPPVVAQLTMTIAAGRRL
jgi:ubiquinone/menaquinone biosynthesis C-methylase UbiE